MYWSFQFTSFIPLLQRALISHLFLFPHSLNIYRASLRLVLMACKTSRKTPEEKDKTKNNPNYLQTTFLPKFCMSITWELLQTNTHYYSYLEGNKQTNEKTSRNASWKDFSKQQPNNLHIPQGKEIKQNQKQNRKTKLQTNQPQQKNPQRSCITYKVLCMDKDSNFPCAFPMGSRSIL